MANQKDLIYITRKFLVYFALKISGDFGSVAFYILQALQIPKILG